jgi:hypothetical protein
VAGPTLLVRGRQPPTKDVAGRIPRAGPEARRFAQGQQAATIDVVRPTLLGPGLDWLNVGWGHSSPLGELLELD